MNISSSLMSLILILQYNWPESTNTIDIGEIAESIVVGLPVGAMLGAGVSFIYSWALIPAISRLKHATIQFVVFLIGMACVGIVATWPLVLVLQALEGEFEPWGWRLIPVSLANSCLFPLLYYHFFPNTTKNEPLSKPFRYACASMIGLSGLSIMIVAFTTG